MTLDAIVEEVVRLGVPMVELTGGEPLAQAAAPALAVLLQAKGMQVLIETSGSEDVSALPKATHIIMDIKCPGSNMQERNKLGNLQHLKPTDDVKFVLAGRADFDWAMELISKEHLDTRFNVLLSCAFGLLKPMDLAAWMLERPALKARLQLQQHKYIWHPRAKGV